MAAANPTPSNGSSLEIFEEAHRKLKFYEDLETTIRIRKDALSPINLAGHQRLGAELTSCKTNILEWKAMVTSANAILRRELRN